MRSKVHFGDEVRKAIFKRGISFAEAGRRIGVSRQKMNELMKRDSIDVKTLAMLSLVLKCDFFKLLDRPPETGIASHRYRKVFAMFEIDYDWAIDIMEQNGL